MVPTSPASHPQSAPPASALQRHPLISYFALAYGIAWLLWLPFVLSKGAGLGLIPLKTSASLSDLAASLLLFVGALGPTAAAIIVSAATEGGAGVRRLLRRIVQVRAGVQWYLVALFVPLATFVVPPLIYGGTQYATRVFSLAGVGALLAYVLGTLLDMVLTTAWAEEIGWRGFALPRLQLRYGPLAGSLILGPLWALWHLPLFFTVWGAAYQVMGLPLGMLLFLVIAMGTTIIMTWLFNNTRGSIFLAILYHSALDSSAILFVVLFPQQATETAAQLGAAYETRGTLGLAATTAIVALLVLAVTRGRLSYKPPVAQAAVVAAPK